MVDLMIISRSGRVKAWGYRTVRRPGSNPAADPTGRRVVTSPCPTLSIFI